MAVSARSQLPLAAYHLLPWSSILHKAALNYMQWVIRYSSFTGLHTCWVTCRAHSPFTCFTSRNHSKHASYPIRLHSFFWPANFMSHDRLVGVNATHWKPFPRPRLSWAAEQPSLPASPCQTKEKGCRTSVNSCQSCHALCRHLTLDKRLVEIPTETCCPVPPPLSTPAAIITSLFYMLIYFISLSFPPFLTPKLFSEIKTGASLLWNAWKYN